MAEMVWNPNQYEKFKDERSKPFFDLMALVEVKPKMKVADLGCGTGELTSVLDRHLAAEKTLGIDSSDEMLERARALIPAPLSSPTSQASSRLKFENGNIEKWNPREKFDLIFSNAALQWCDDHESLFRRLASKLKDDGQLAVQMPMNQDYPTHIVAREMAAEIAPDFTIQDSMLSLGEYASMLYRLGFRRQTAFVKVYGHVLESRSGVIEWVKGTTLTRFKSRLTPKEYEIFLREYERRLFSEIEETTPFFYPFKRIFLWARR